METKKEFVDTSSFSNYVSCEAVLGSNALCVLPLFRTHHCPIISPVTKHIRVYIHLTCKLRSATRWF